MTGVNLSVTLTTTLSLLTAKTCTFVKKSFSLLTESTSNILIISLVVKLEFEFSFVSIIIPSKLKYFYIDKNF